MKTENIFTFTCKVSNVDFTTPFHVESESHHSQFFSHCSTGRLGWCHWFRYLRDTETVLLQCLAFTGGSCTHWARNRFHLSPFHIPSDIWIQICCLILSGTHGFTLAPAGGSGRKIHFPYQFYLLSQLSIELFHFVNKWYKIHAWIRKHVINNVYCSRT